MTRVWNIGQSLHLVIDCMEESGAQGRGLDWKYICVEGLSVEKVTEVLGVDEMAQGPDIKGHMKRILGCV